MRTCFSLLASHSVGCSDSKQGGASHQVGDSSHMSHNHHIIIMSVTSPELTCMVATSLRLQDQEEAVRTAHEMQERCVG